MRTTRELAAANITAARATGPIEDDWHLAGSGVIAHIASEAGIARVRCARYAIVDCYDPGSKASATPLIDDGMPSPS